MMSLSVIMPALNEENNIERAIKDVLEGFSYYNVDGELILVNDGSSDRTAEIMSAYRMRYPGKIKVISHPDPMGIGASFWDGVRSAGKDLVVMMPGDAENEAGEVLKYVGLMDHVDIMVPYVVNRGVRKFSRELISKIFLSVINFSFGLSLNYTNGTVVYRKAVFDDVVCVEPGFFYQVEALVKSIRKGYMFAEVPCALARRVSGGSKAVTFRSLIRVIRAYVRLLAEIYVLRGHMPAKPFAPGTAARAMQERCHGA
jgi:dolichol-phosphate mannosyltransferase